MKREEGFTIRRFIKPEYARLILLGVLGVLFIIFGSFLGAKDAKENVTEIGSLKAHEKDLEEELERVLSAMAGVGKVSVALTLESGPESVFAKNVSRQVTSQKDDERESESLSETLQPVVGRVSSSDSPLVERVCGLKVSGCLVVAEGASSPKTKMEIYRSVETLLSIPIYKIQVVPMKGGE